MDPHDVPITIPIAHVEPVTYLCLKICLIDSFEADGQLVKLKLNDVPRLCLTSKFSSYEDRLRIYRTLAEIQEIPPGTMVYPLHMFSRMIANQEIKRDYYLALDLGVAKSLREFVSEHKDDFFGYLLKGGGRTAYTFSDLYIYLLRSLVEGIRRLHISRITASLNLEDIYVLKEVAKEDDDGWSRMEKGKSKVIVKHVTVKARFVFGKYMTREKSQRHKLGDWLELANTLKEINNLLDLNVVGKDLIFQISSFIDALVSMSGGTNRSSNQTETLLKDLETKLNVLSTHPIFWNWIKRMNLIIGVSDLMINRRITVNTNRLNIAFGQDWAENIKQDPEIGWLANLDPEFETNKNCGPQECLYFLRNQLIHCLKTTITYQQEVVKIKSAEVLVDKICQLFPNAIHVLASIAAAYEKKCYTDSRRLCTDDDCTCVHGVWPVHVCC